MMSVNTKNKGFTLVEIVASLLILAVAITGIMALFPIGVKSLTDSSDSLSASMLAQLKINHLLYGRPASMSADAAHPGPLVCWNGSSLNSIIWDGAGWVYDTGNGNRPYIFKDNPKFYWAARKQEARLRYSMASYDVMDDLYTLDFYVFRKEKLPGNTSDYVTGMPALSKYTILFHIYNPSY